MKKKYLLFALVLFSIVLVGCGNNDTKKDTVKKSSKVKEEVLTCSMDEDMEGGAMTQIFTVNLKNDKAYFYDAGIDIVAQEAALTENWAKFVELIDEYVAEEFNFKEQKGVKLVVKNDDSNYKYSIHVELDVDEASTETKQEIVMESDKIDLDNNSIDEIKTAAEDRGYTCSISEK